jgi:AAA15 family ATPase/GTPase
MRKNYSGKTAVLSAFGLCNLTIHGTLESKMININYLKLHYSLKDFTICSRQILKCTVIVG